MPPSSETLVLQHTSLRFAFLDSGAPKDKADYPTLFLIHGLGFNAETFRRLLPLSSQHGVRMIAVHRRGYGETSPLNETEVNVMTQGSFESRSAFIRGQGSELAAFLDQVAQKLRLPESGGITVLGWSLGTLFLYALLAAIASPTILSSESRQRLQSCIKKVVVYDAPPLPIGLSITSHHLNPFTDPSIPPESKGAAFSKWVSSFWHHPDLASRSVDALNSTAPSATKKPTIETIPFEELQAMMDQSGAGGEMGYAVPGWLEVYASLRDEVLFSESFKNGWSNLPRAVWLYGDESPWEPVSTAWIIQDMVQKTSSHLDIKFQVLEGTNHFAMVEEPDRFLQAVLTS